MKKWNLISESQTPDGSVMSLYEHDGDYSIRVGGIELMSTRQHSSEERMAEIGCGHLKAQAKPRILIGGLGFGYTLKAALKFAPDTASIAVAELMQAVIDWNLHPDLPLASDALADRRVRLVNKDVMSLIRAERIGYDTILLDVDNGPRALSTEGNSDLYDDVGLHQVYGALRPGGCVVFWSAVASPTFAKLMGKVGFEVSVSRTKSNGMKGSWHTLFLGRRGHGAAQTTSEGRKTRKK